ncbi:carbohydrate ABC transporter permease [Chloroflexi bacterium TSY]|nr:carbohydrate ABC transporter permease [Chloroflexi bacterium TSY]
MSVQASSPSPSGMRMPQRSLQSRIFWSIPWKRIVTHLVAIFFMVFIVAPFSWIIITSFMFESEAISVPPHWIPEEPTLRNFQAYLAPESLKGSDLVSSGGMNKGAFIGQGAVKDSPTALLNSTIVAFSVAILNMIIGGLGGYAFARLRFRGSMVMMLFYLGSRMVPAIAIMIPLYILVKNYTLLDTKLSLIFAYTTFTIPYSVWILASYFQTIPRDLEDAARVDRCNWLQMMWRVFLPVATPGLIAVAMMSFLSAWGEFLFALLFTSTMNSKTIPIMIAQLVTDVDTSPVLMTAGGVLAVIPPLVLALLFQRLIISGITVGAVKG